MKSSFQNGEREKVGFSVRSRGGEMWARHLSGSFSRGFIWDNIKTGENLYLVGIYVRRWPSAKGVTAGKVSLGNRFKIFADIFNLKH